MSWFEETFKILIKETGEVRTLSHHSMNYEILRRLDVNSDAGVRSMIEPAVVSNFQLCSDAQGNVTPYIVAADDDSSRTGSVVSHNSRGSATKSQAPATALTFSNLG